ncbi:hypothetical protein L1F30_15970 [Simiduia sp. 21SJ11W-1]|uniref:hypothetical protein n=1 Tax=Simiduia sp. 21SJ11W-1 TaxID=2909669 RepID=UPI0020A00982|nr:hypothetical protein [Simiduia sp. 21SJ11W-1]UTA47640.1 hypothetical protein L1F30_15970 [Simiduia sp. 21SJ11W-1]
MSATRVLCAHWVALGITAITAALFFIDYFVLGGNLPGYGLVAYPGIVWLRMFSEEIDFWPKFLLLMLGQYLAYFAATFVLLCMRSRLKKPLGK